MSDETYYTVLNLKETASLSEIKTAYRDLIRQVHPDTITNLAPYLRKIAEDKAKEINEAYGVLSNSSKRRDYDNQLAAYRRQTTPPAQAPATPQTPRTPPPQQHSQCPVCGRSDGGHSAACANSRTSQSTSSGPYCNTCGTSLYASGYCPKCSKFATPSATTAKPAATPKVIRRFGYNWGPLLDWAGEHPLLVVFLFLIGVFSIGALFSDSNTQPSASSSSATSSASPAPVTNNAKAASTGPYSAYPCDYREKVSSIDGKPCAEKRESIPAPPPGFKAVSNPARTNHPAVSVTGVYVGTVNNQTANLSSSFTVVIYPAKTGTLEGCMEVKPPLYGSGVLRGSVTGSRVNFVVADITFQGDASKDVITGSYVVTRQTGNQLGEFHLMKQVGAEALYHCQDGVVTSSLTANHVPSQDKVVPTAPNVAVRSPDASATALTQPDSSVPRAHTKEPDLSGLAYSERQSIEAACSHAKYIEGPAAYDQCLLRQFQAWEAGPKEPNLTALTNTERESIQAACSHAKYIEGPAAYDRCLIRQLEAWTTGPKAPDLSGLTPSESQSIQSACSHAKYIEGPLAYDRCLIRQLQTLTNYRQ